MPVRSSLAKSFPRWSRKDLDPGAEQHSRDDMHNAEGGVPSTSGTGLTRLHSSPERFRADSSGHLNRVPEDGAVDFDARPERNDDDEEEEEEEEEWEMDGLYRGSYRKLVILYSLAPLTFGILFILLGLLPTWAYTLEHEPTYPSDLPFPLLEIIVAAGLWCLSYLLRDPIYSFCALICTPFRLSHLTVPFILSTFLHTIVSVLLRLATIPALLIPHHLTDDTITWRDPAFRRVWWVALGWAAIEAVVGVKQGYESIALYRDVLFETDNEERFIDIEDGATKLDRMYGATERTVPLNTGTAAEEQIAGSSSREESPHTVTTSTGPGSSRAHLSTSAADLHGDPERAPLLQRRSDMTDISNNLEQSLELQVDQDVEQLMAVRARDELERAYGIPFIRIPVFIICLHRANSLLLSLGLTLLLASAYLHSTATVPPSIFDTPGDPVSESFGYSMYSITPTPTWSWTSATTNSGSSNRALAITLPLVFVIQLLLSLLHSQLVLPRVGVHSVVYIGSLVSLGVFFAGLGVWDALS